MEMKEMNEVFLKDLSKGKKGEMIIKNYLVEKQKMLFISENDDIRYDLLMLDDRGRLIKYEIKTDEFATFQFETGNLFIEFQCSGKPSGVFASEADYYVYFFPQERKAYFTSKEKLLKNKHLFHISYNCGGNGTVKGFIVDRQDFSYLFTIVDIPLNMVKSII